jgi:hypothetical protein
MRLQGWKIWRPVGDFHNTGKAFQTPNSVNISTKLLQDSLFLEGRIGSLRVLVMMMKEGWKIWRPKLILLEQTVSDFSSGGCRNSYKGAGGLSSSRGGDWLDYRSN